MISLINRISWILSISLGILLIYVFFGREIGYGSDGVFFLLITGTIVGCGIKKILLGREFITDRIVEYTNKVVDRASKNIPAGVPKPQNAQAENIKPNTISVPASIPVPSAEIPYYGNLQEEEEEYVKIQKEEIAEKIEKPEESSGPSVFERFFAENALAKIGGIFLFLGVLFFLGYVFNNVGAVGKLIIGFVAGFSFFAIGVVLDGKGYTQESRTMLGVGILVNYLVILSGRYLIGEGNPIVETDVAILNSNTSTLLTEGTTFLFLILNTIFAVATSLVYKSKTLLLFSFVFAYLNPFLIGAKADGTPYTLVGYATIISLGALFLSKIFYDNKENKFAKYLSVAGFLGGNILFVLAPITTSGHWALKLFFLALISILTLALAYKNDEKENIGTFFIAAYIAFMFMLFTGSAAGILKTSVAFISYIAFLGLMLAYSVFFIAAASVASIGFILFAPLIFLFFLLISGSLFIIVPVILGVLLVYLFVFSLVFESISLWLKYIFFVMLGIFLAVANVSIGFGTLIVLDFVTHTSIIIAGAIFLFASYYFSRKEGMSYLFSIGNIGTILLLLPIIRTSGEFMNASIIAIVVFSLSNMLAPFFIENLRTKDLRNLAISLVIGILFTGGELYNYGAIAKLFPGIPLGYSFMGLAAFYFALGFGMMQVLGANVLSESSKSKESIKNAIFSYLGVSISLFSLAILIIFASQPAVVASIWFFESTILFFFYKRLKDMKVYLAACVLFIVGIVKYSAFIPTIVSEDYISLIPLIFVGASLILNLYFLKDDKGSESRIAHDILHIIGLIMIGAGVANIVPHTGQGYGFFSISIVLVLISIFYNLFGSNLTIYALIFFSGLFYLGHIFSIDQIFYTLKIRDKESLKALQYLVVLIPGIWLYFRSSIGGRLDKVKSPLIISYIAYLFISTTIFIYNITDNNVFSITIYWAIWAFFYLSNGINKDLQKWRTIGLYILTLVIAKILLYDVWFGINDTILRVFALMFVGGLMIYISMMYSKKYPGNLLNEFSLSNFSPLEKTPEIKVETKKTPTVNEKIKDVEIGDISTVIFELSNGKRYMIRSKNLIKISKLIENNFGKSEFAAGELLKYYTFVINNYKSELSEADYAKVLGVMREFVDVGGSVKFS